jgi:hypothetical protein
LYYNNNEFIVIIVLFTYAMVRAKNYNTIINIH